MPTKPAQLWRSTAIEDYLGQVLELIKAKGYARVAGFAPGLTISQARVTNIVQELDAEGLLKSQAHGR